MTKDEAMKLALEALEPFDRWKETVDAITAIRESLAQPEQEPVAWRDHVEQRLLAWRQSFVNKSGDQLALDDFMDKRSLDDLIDFVCDEYSDPKPEHDYKRLYEAAAEKYNALSELMEKKSEQEPVALEDVYLTIIQWDVGGGKRSRRELARRIVDLYSTPQPAQQQEPLGYLYELIVEGQVVNEKFTSVNWDTRYEPFGRNGVDHGGKVTKTPLYTSPPASKPWVGLTNQELIDLTAIYSGAPLYCAIEAKLREKNT